ncbi:MAG: hypothetical protein LBI44_06535 [Oscillospiraceae bacterium]|jgi:hypothetical protein|nr:hypothetical protein [Oscillospiraceae bacterium]
MEYKSEERAKHAKVNRSIMLAWGIVSGAIATVVLLIVALVVFWNMDRLHREITKSTERRTPLAVDQQLRALVNAGRFSLLSDNMSDYKLVYTPRDWNIAVADFYEKTGVLLHLRTEDSAYWLTQQGREEAYREAFGDEDMTGPYLLIIFSRQKDSERPRDEYAHICGTAAAALIDMEAAAIIEDCVSRRYLFRRGIYFESYPAALAYAAKRIMTPSVAPSLLPALLLCAVVIPGVAAFFIIRHRKHKKDEAIHEVLNTDIDELAKQARDQGGR